MKYVIINADDFGLSKGVNAGIIKGYKEGVLTSATLMANMMGFDEAVSLWNANRGLGVGVHLNILRGKPILSRHKVGSLIQGETFPGKIGIVIKRLLLGQIDLKQVESEWRAQIEKVINAGIKPTHLDSEKHLHLIPPLFRVAAKLADEFGFRWVRNIKEHLTGGIKEYILGNYLFDAQFYKMILLTSFSKKMELEISEKTFLTPDYFYGVLHSGKMDKERFQYLFSKIEEGVTELMCHPGAYDESDELDGNMGSYYINKFRQIELEGLIHPSVKDKAKQLGIHLVNYGDLN